MQYRINRLKKYAQVALAVIYLSCSGQATFKPLSTDVSYPAGQGDPALMQGELLPEVEAILAKTSDEHYLVAEDSLERLVSILERKPDLANVTGKTQKMSQKAGFAMPWVRYSDLAKVSDCRIPAMSLGNSVLLKNVEWLIFTYCELKIAPEAKENKEFPEHFPKVKKFNKRTSALRFIVKSLLKSFNKHKVWRYSDSEKLAFFERLFLTTQFRLPTQTEADYFANEISEKGLFYTTIVYLCRWYFSNFYQEHLNFSRAPLAYKQAYQSVVVSGQIINESGSSVSGVAYSNLASANFPGFYEKDISGELPSEKEPEVHHNKGRDWHHHKKHYDKDRADNFFLQFYVPKKLKFNKHKPFTLPLFLKAQGFPNQPATLTLQKKKTKHVMVTLLQEVPEVDDPWPDNAPLGTYTAHLNFYPNLASESFEGCDIPSLRNGIVDGVKWQEFVRCRTGIRSGTKEYDIAPLLNRKAALDYLTFVWRAFARSDASIKISDIDRIELFFSLVTFHGFTSAEKNRILIGLANSDVDTIYFSMLADFYKSFAFDKFDFQKEPVLPLKSYTFSGKIQDNGGAGISGAEIKIKDQTGLTLTQVQSNAAGEYSLNFYLPAYPLIGNNETDLIVSASGYSRYVESFRSAPATASLEKNIMLSPMNTVSVAAGGTITSPTGFVQIDVPAGAVNEDVSFQIRGEQESLLLSRTDIPTYRF
ncbi:MAG: carboxypeptidase regulatory-like domain-containing protein, partial [Candidatus Hydrogenedentota bacterium]